MPVPGAQPKVQAVRDADGNYHADDQINTTPLQVWNVELPESVVESLMAPPEPPRIRSRVQASLERVRKRLQEAKV